MCRSGILHNSARVQASGIGADGGSLVGAGLGPRPVDPYRAYRGPYGTVVASAGRIT